MNAFRAISKEIRLMSVVGEASLGASPTSIETILALADLLADLRVDSWLGTSDKTPGAELVDAMEGCSFPLASVGGWMGGPR